MIFDTESYVEEIERLNRELDQANKLLVIHERAADSVKFVNGLRKLGVTFDRLFVDAKFVSYSLCCRMRAKDILSFAYSPNSSRLCLCLFFAVVALAAQVALFVGRKVTIRWN